ncbi:MAG TPA: helix-turn-helix transcriptional regulator [Oligoflexus sp.]|uniref:helix-turn-helix transcriptional regulator n=1 Tax=Oligoflexus sp. TaxID=1971216 RepID=UPI002D7E2393|nr:helix-turn-helix transcriptional regulator [Oligoflexus sp.]HET9241209.1 helix-turn-helix transcriptional regulator [Oligoflexus sp.]
MVPTADKSALFSQLIKDWILEKRGRNLYVLARNSGLSYTNLRAIEAGKSDVTLDTALRLLRYIQPDAATTQTVLNFYPDIAPMLGHLSQLKARNGSYRLLSQKACRAAVEIYGRRRIACDELHGILGPGAESIVEELTQVDLIRVEEDHYLPTHPFFHLSSPDVLIPFMRLFLDNVHRDVPWNLVEARFSGLKPEAAAEVQSILEDARLRVMRIKENPDNAGDLTVAWGMVMTLF